MTTGPMWAHHRGSLVAACLLVASMAACSSAPSSESPPPPSATTTAPARATAVETATTTTSTPPSGSSRDVVAWTHDELRVELLEMMRQDQLERTGDGLPPGTRLPPIQDHARATRLAEIVDEHGWPTFDMVGVEGATAAWLIAQHADHDVDLQLHWLDLIDAAARSGQADPTELAYLVDRVAVNQGAPQRYGTQIRCRDGEPAPATPIEDDVAVDERRREVGLDPLADYYDELAMMCAQEGVEGQGPAD